MDAKSTVETFFRESASREVTQAIHRAIPKARNAGLHVCLAHVVLELLDDPEVTSTLQAAIRNKASAILYEQIATLPTVERPDLGFKLDVLLEPALKLSRRWGGTDKVSALAFLATCLNPAVALDHESQRTRELLRTAGLTLESLLPPVDDEADVLRREFRFESLGFGVDLTAKAAAGVWEECPLVGMEDELRKVIKVLNAKADSVVLTGEPGVGKSVLMEGFAYKIVKGDGRLVPATMKSWTVVMIEAGDIIKSAGVVGGLEREMKRILKFFRQNPTVIPFFDEIHRLLDTGDDNIKAVANAMKPSMANGLFQCVGATTNREYAQFIASDDALRSRLRRIQLVEPDAKAAALIIQGSMPRLLEGRAKPLGISLSSEAIESAIRVTTTYQRTERLPRKAINLLKIAVSEKVYEVDIEPEAGSSRVVSAADVNRVFSELSDIPVAALGDDRSSYYKLVGGRLAERVIGQHAAIDVLTRWLTLQSRGWVDARRPRGRFVFTGPPGVGKTELARGLAEELMRDPESLVVLDLGDYQDEMALSKFMGASAGYVGFGATPTVYTRVMTRPYSVIVLDEIEKCNPSLSNPLLSILDGFAEDARGNRVDFSQTIIIMTSNSLDIQGTDAVLRAELRKLGGVWTAPLLDRVDKVCAFGALDDEILSAILDGLVAKRSAAASHPLPEQVSSIAAKRAILAAAVGDGGRASARGLDRALLAWMDEAANQGSRLSE